MHNLTPYCRETLETRLRSKIQHKKQDADKTAVDKKTFFKCLFTALPCRTTMKLHPDRVRVNTEIVKWLLLKEVQTLGAILPTFLFPTFLPPPLLFFFLLASFDKCILRPMAYIVSDEGFKHIDALQ